ncbi:MAG: DEAD/DEAH box helicase [Hyphomicrobiaceae bacterium]|nr:MAG: DEAD/DEAH box helicase [Hyphomicrobiaceae bacterium]
MAGSDGVERKAVSSLLGCREAMRTYGKLWLDGNSWHMQCEPHVAVMAKRIFQRIPAHASGEYVFENTPSIARDLEWFTQRYPMDVTNRDQLQELSKRHRDNIATLDQLIDPRYKPPSVKMAIPPRDYQLRVPAVHNITRGLLLADAVGTGKTCSACCTFTDPAKLPAIVVCPAHLPKQWKREISRFLPDLDTHIIKTKKLYELPKFMGRGPDVLIVSYFKLAEWQEILKAYGKSIVFDEVQELRKGETQKYNAAKNIAEGMEYRLGLSATPIYNYGGEIFNVLDILTPDLLGTPGEFYQEWCFGGCQNSALKDPGGFGSWLREQHIMLRRTRQDVGRELPKLSVVTQPIDCDEKVLEDIEGRAGELARIIMGHTEAKGIDKMEASSEFSMILRQATGISKAPHVAAFVEMIAGNGEKVVLFGWHRAVYEIWKQELYRFKPVMYTGSESPAAKASAIDQFVNGESQVLIVSLRSGAGVDGLQKAASVVVFGEIDWSPGIHEQCIGRLYRDGQENPVQAFYLLSNSGSDPFMAEILGLKKDQADGLVGESVELQTVDSREGIRKMAQRYLKGR